VRALRISPIPGLALHAHEFLSGPFDRLLIDFSDQAVLNALIDQLIDILLAGTLLTRPEIG
jgi:hypothetical protein